MTENQSINWKQGCLNFFVFLLAGVVLLVLTGGGFKIPRISIDWDGGDDSQDVAKASEVSSSSENLDEGDAFCLTAFRDEEQYGNQYCGNDWSHPVIMKEDLANFSHKWKVVVVIEKETFYNDGGVNGKFLKPGEYTLKPINAGLSSGCRFVGAQNVSPEDCGSGPGSSWIPKELWNTYCQ